MEKENKKEMENKIVEWYDNPNLITTLAIITLTLIIVLSQSFAVKNNIGSHAILRNLLNHNSIYLVGLLYFIPLKMKLGKKYFNFFNIFFIMIYAIFMITSILTVIQSLSLTSLITLGLYIVLLIYMIHSLLHNTRLWRECKIEKSPFNDISNINYFYTIVILAVILLTIDLIQATSFDGAFLSLLVTVYTILFARYIYLYWNHSLQKVKKKGVK